MCLSPPLLRHATYPLDHSETCYAATIPVHSLMMMMVMNPDSLVVLDDDDEQQSLT